MTTPATASSLAQALTAEALTRTRRRLLTGHPDPTRANTPTSGSPTDEQLRVLAASDWAPPRMTTLDANTLATADAVTRALLAESMRETLERRLVVGALPGYSGSWRRHITHSAQMLARAIAEPDYQWSGVAWR